MFNKFLYQNKFVIEKKYKIYNRNQHTHKIYWNIYIYEYNARLHITYKIYWTIIIYKKKTIQGYTDKKSYMKINI